MKKIRSLAHAFYAVLVSVALLGCAAHRVAGTGAAAPDKGYLLITIKSNMQGVLPLKPDSFWGVPLFVGLEPQRHYLLQMKSGGYSFGGLTVGRKTSRDTYNGAPFTIEPGKVVYLGEHSFMQDSDTTYFWDVRDSLDEALGSLQGSAAKEIEGLPIERKIPKSGKVDGAAKNTTH